MVDTGRGSDKLYFHYKSIPRWNKEGKLVHIKKPLIEITFRKFSEAKSSENREMRMNALVDSGADWSFLPKEIANALHLDMETTDDRILTIAGETNVYTSKVYAEIQRSGKLPIPIGFVNVHVMPHMVEEIQVPHFVILGRKDFFEKFEVTINESAQYIVLKDIHKDRLKKTRF
ncbi:MAG TPA: aspartyl protease family protein [Nitrosopumilaceae archaeon]|nr:aspartyl protease family protein [Nitrosopumilaceae archaeon]